MPSEESTKREKVTLLELFKQFVSRVWQYSKQYYLLSSTSWYDVYRLDVESDLLLGVSDLGN